MVDLTDPSILSRLLQIKDGGIPETPQGDVLTAPQLFSTDAEDLQHGVLLPPVELGEMTNLVGQPGFDKTTTEYLVHFRLSDVARDRLKEFCLENLKREFMNNQKKLKPFIDRAYQLAVSEDPESAWGVFKSFARKAWRDDGSFLLKVRSTKKNPRFVCIRSAEGVDHTGHFTPGSGSIVRPEVRSLSWGFKANDMYGVTLQLGIGGLTVYRASCMPEVHKTFRPGNFYLCVRPDKTYELRNVGGHAVRMRIPYRPCEATECIYIDESFAESVQALENKIGCPLSCVDHCHELDQHMMKVDGSKTVSTGVGQQVTHCVVRPVIRTNGSLRTLAWILDTM